MQRPLKVYAFDPSRGSHLGNHMTVRVPYEERLRPGPVGSRIAVIDFDASNRCYYAPVDLDDPALLLTQGLDPSDSNPQFHQQMAYAVAWETVSLFEQALGRSIRWRFARRDGEAELAEPTLPERDHLRIFPHAMQEANAYYSRDLGALLFGYFQDERDVDAGHPAPRIVYSCLSHDIVAHETTHALLDVFRPNYIYSTNPDVAAFHEAFADIVALFQHFSVREALLDTIQRTGGELHRRDLEPDARADRGGPLIVGQIPGANPLLALAQQFGQAMGARTGLRSALGSKPTPDALATTFEAHGRGAILVAAVFDAFFTAYLRRTRDLMRIARAGGAVTPAGDLHPDLANRLAAEASKTASHFLRMSVRALDLCPTVDVTFGDFLRALVTIDAEAVPLDEYGYREALITAFVARGIRPEGTTSTSEDAVRLPTLEPSRASRFREIVRLDLLQTEIDALRLEGRRNSDAYRSLRKERAALVHGLAERHRKVLGLDGGPVQVSVVARSLRVRQDGIVRPEHVILLNQVRKAGSRRGTFTVRGGSAVVLSPDGYLRHVIAKPVRSRERLAQQRAHRARLLDSDPRVQYAGRRALHRLAHEKETLDFAALHRGY